MGQAGKYLPGSGGLLPASCCSLAATRCPPRAMQRIYTELKEEQFFHNYCIPQSFSYPSAWTPAISTFPYFHILIFSPSYA
jgi:hypothetical protein